MPVYEYECKNCGQRFEKIQPVTSDPLTECQLCGQGPVRRVLHPVGVIFKGSGWYSTDSRKSNSASTSSASGGSDSKSSNGTESKPAESKPAEGKPSTESSASTPAAD